jgi:hypothetical protein
MTRDGFFGQIGSISISFSIGGRDGGSEIDVSAHRHVSYIHTWLAAQPQPHAETSKRGEPADGEAGAIVVVCLADTRR